MIAMPCSRAWCSAASCQRTGRACSASLSSNHKLPFTAQPLSLGRPAMAPEHGIELTFLLGCQAHALFPQAAHHTEIQQLAKPHRLVPAQGSSSVRSTLSSWWRLSPSGVEARSPSCASTSWMLVRSLAPPVTRMRRRPASRAGTSGGAIQAWAYACTKLADVGIGLGCLGWMNLFRVWMFRRPGGGWGSTAKPCWKPLLALLLA
jgi:hypothetical protein